MLVGITDYPPLAEARPSQGRVKMVLIDLCRYQCPRESKLMDENRCKMVT
jgi:hypothetical protein